MRQVPATHLGPYEILAPLGAGGMGEVYQARDIRAGRELAVKILTRASARHPSRRARFEQEGRAVAALNHPNIVRVHDVGEADGILYIVSELVRGQTLTALMECGRLPLKQLLDLAAQTAEGLAVAHAAGIVHRDLKPANVMVTPEGKVKILDFGLECQVGAAAAAGATMMVAQTDPGVMLGAVNYISPEQARGSVADYRSDQFSFGLILYEMASGQPAFQRGEPVQTMSAILTEEPPPIERNVPAPLRWTIGRCLAKDPGGRYESTRDLFHDLKGLRDHLSELSSAAAVPAAWNKQKSLPEPGEGPVAVRWPEELLGTVARTIELRFRPGLQSVVVSFEQDLFIISREGKIVGKDKFAYTFGEGDSCLRYLSLRAKKSDNSVGRVVIRFLDDLGAEVMAPIEAVTSVTPLWGCSSI